LRALPVVNLQPLVSAGGKDWKMALQVFLSSTLRKHVSDYDPSRGIRIEVAVGTTVRDLCERLRVPGEEVKVIMVNGRSARSNKPLNGDERVALFPPVGGG